MDGRDFISGAAKVERSLGGLVSNIAGGFAKIGLAAAGVRTVFDALIGPMKEAQEAALAERKLAQVFKSTANAAGVSKDAIMAYAAERQKMTSFDADDTVNAAAIMGSFTNIKGNMFTDALTSAQDLSAFMGQDLQSSVLQIGKALNDPARGVSALAKAGIQFSQAQKEEIKVLQETGQLADAQAIILKELQTQFGGQAEALVDPIAQAKNAWGDFMETIGGLANEKLLPLMPKIIEGFESVSNFIEGTVDNIKEMSQAIDDLAFAAAALATGQDVGQAFADRANRIAGWENAASTVKSVRERAAGGMGDHQSAIGDILAQANANKALFDKSAVTFDEPQIDMTGVTLTNGSGRSLADVRALNRETEQATSMGIINQLDEMMASIQPAVTGGKGSSNQVGSLEKGSQEAFDVLRANTSGGDKDVAQKQLKAAEKSNENLAKILKVLNDPKSSRKDVNVVLRGID
jgi:phage-related minor tail protein